jgi:hypothetical protein
MNRGQYLGDDHSDEKRNKRVQDMQCYSYGHQIFPREKELKIDKVLLKLKNLIPADRYDIFYHYKGLFHQKKAEMRFLVKSRGKEVLPSCPRSAWPREDGGGHPGLVPAQAGIQT